MVDGTGQFLGGGWKRADRRGEGVGRRGYCGVGRGHEGDASAGLRKKEVSQESAA
jgi:hypothetical protein